MKNLYKYIIPVLFVFANTLNAQAQIFVANGVYSEKTEYSDLDSVFVFCSDLDDAILAAIDSSGHGGYNYSWFKYDESSQDFTIALSGESINIDSTQSEMTGLSSGGYMVELQKSGTTQTYIAWLHNYNSLSVDL